MNDFEDFPKRVKGIIAERFGRPTAYAYLHRPRGSPRIAESTIKQWLTGKCLPSISELVAFADEMGVTLDYLVLGCGPKTPGIAREEADLSKDLRAYLVAVLSRDASPVAPTRFRGAGSTKFHEDYLPRGEGLLDDVAALVRRHVQEVFRERAQRTRKRLVNRLLTQLRRTRDGKRRMRLQAQIATAFERAGAGEGSLLLDEAAEAAR